jgi:hypothetical protein
MRSAQRTTIIRPNSSLADLSISANFHEHIMPYFNATYKKPVNMNKLRKSNYELDIHQNDSQIRQNIRNIFDQEDDNSKNNMNTYSKSKNVSGRQDRCVEDNDEYDISEIIEAFNPIIKVNKH